MFYVVIEKTHTIVEWYDTLSAPDVQERTDYYGEAVYIISGQRDNSTEPKERF